MRDSEFDLPPDWRVAEHAEQSDGAIKFRFRTATGTMFTVEVVSDPEVSNAHQLRLSTDTPTNVRHNYLIDSYESKESTVSAAESFAKHLMRRVRQNKLSASDPSVNAVQETIKEFGEDSLLVSLRRNITQLW
ncbi:hypothetical protein [Halobacterium rubrum]|uniref:hypothetical protein n=1 Tax=Halobacterium TaxID=2239 RepID=UPI001F287F06|nr:MULTISPECIES: hypothetical protein [Halobacterium]MDH5020315.1 hypothetical protein [Halobacterium rubrum]